MPSGYVAEIPMWIYEMYNKCWFNVVDGGLSQRWADVDVVCCVGGISSAEVEAKTQKKYLTPNNQNVVCITFDIIMIMIDWGNVLVTIINRIVSCHVNWFHGYKKS